jgi:regulator of sigma E protease
MGTSVIAFIIVLGILIFFHELGHFLVARFFGVGVEKFSLGFGPRLVGKRIGLTDYRISAIPLGGYVKMVGEEPDAELSPQEIPLSFTHKSVLQRILIVAAGPLFNILLAVIIFFFLFFISGIFILQPIIGTVEPGSPAALAGLQVQDRILAIGEQDIESWEEMAEIITAGGGQLLQLLVQREGEARRIEVTPITRTTQNLFGEDIERHVIGITSSGDVVSKSLGLFEALSQSLLQTYRITELTIVSVGKLLKGTLSVKTLGGPIMIADMAGQQAKEGMANLAFFIGLISINLAILNFLPIPVLDGGHLLFFTIEAIIRRPVHLRVREIAQQVGIVFLLLLMLFVIGNDISRYLPASWF